MRVKNRRRKGLVFQIRRTKKLYLKYVLMQLLVLLVCVGLDHFAREKAEPVVTEDVVSTGELAGYLQIIPLSPVETRSLLLPKLGEKLTGEGVFEMIDFLQLGESGDKLKDNLNIEPNEQITYEVWCGIYEQLLELLHLREQVSVIDLQYLGKLQSEGRLMADSGNYDCDIESIDFVYGEYYQVYIAGKLLLGKAVDQMKEGCGPEEDASENGEQPEDLTLIPEIPDQIRVLVTQDNHQQIYHENVYLKSTAEFQICKGDLGAEQETAESVAANQSLNCRSWMEAHETTEMVLLQGENGSICLTDAQGNSLSDGYSGRMHLFWDEYGIRVVNELSMEEYLCGVVPGEMPEQFEIEALKTQAVCARTYASRLVSQKKYETYQADLTDTTDCQVYLPSKQNEKSNTAVHETSGQVLSYQESLADIYYFSTSCGFTSGMEVWQLDQGNGIEAVSLLQMPESVVGENISFDDFLRRTDVAAYDSGSRFFRWTATLSVGNAEAEIKEAIQKEIDKGTGKVGIEELDGKVISSVDQLGEFVHMEVVSRNSSGMVTDLVLQFENGRVHFFHENTIRRVLGCTMESVKDNNNEMVHTMNMLPSAAFSVETGADGIITLYGGGLGHGIGMSQYGADGMAKTGMSYVEILNFFFPGTKLLTSDSGAVG